MGSDSEGRESSIKSLRIVEEDGTMRDNVSWAEMAFGQSVRGNDSILHSMKQTSSIVP